MKLWDSDLGIWTLLDTGKVFICGTTPRNADIWTFTAKIGRYTFWFDGGPHASVCLYDNKDDRDVWFLERNDPACRCFSCERYPLRMTDEEIRAINVMLSDPNKPIRKLPPRNNA